MGAGRAQVEPSMACEPCPRVTPRENIGRTGHASIEGSHGDLVDEITRD